jgi:hypothetical protein
MLKRTLIFGAAFGCAFAIAGIFGLAAMKWYSSRPKAWDAKSITCVSSVGGPTYQLKTETRDFKLAGFNFTFVLANNTDRDYTVPQNLKLLRRGSSKALADFAGSVERAVLIPPGERGELSIWTDYSCSNFDEVGRETEREVETCFHDAFGNVSGFVALDEDKRIRINLPKPELKLSKREVSAPDRQNPTTRPDKGDARERAAGCYRANDLVSRCNTTRIQLPKDSFAAHGGWADNMADLPEPPKGYKLDPSSKTCEIAKEWQNYCEKKK